MSYDEHEATMLRDACPDVDEALAPLLLRSEPRYVTVAAFAMTAALTVLFLWLCLLAAILATRWAL